MSKDEGQRDIFTIDSNNPAPFTQPFLVIHFRNGKMWHIDVGGRIDTYLNNFTAVKKAVVGLSDEEMKKKGIPWFGSVIGECSDWRSQATPLFQSMLDRLKEFGYVADRANSYEGSAGPSHVLLHGALFERMKVADIDNAPKEPPEKKENNDVAQYIPALLGS